MCRTFTKLHLHSLLRAIPHPSLCSPPTSLGSEKEGVLWGINSCLFSFGVSVCAWHDLYVLVYVSLLTVHSCTVQFRKYVSVRAVFSAACFCLCVNVLCVCVCIHYGLCSSQQEVQVDTVTAPRRATEGPCHPTTQALSLCFSWLVMDFLLSLFLSLSLPFLVSPFSCLKS